MSRIWYGGLILAMWISSYECRTRDNICIQEKILPVSEAKLAVVLQWANVFLEGKLCIGLCLSFP